MEEKELFENYEHKVWEWTPRLYKLIALATTVNLLGILVLSQFNIFSTRGCDTPYVGIVCQAMDSAYIASVFYGKGFEADSRPYIPTEIGDDEVVTIIDVTDQLKYPDGYFANQKESSETSPIEEGFNPLTDPNNPLGTTQSNKPDGVLPPQVLPTPNKSLGKQDDIDSPFNQDGDKKTNFPPVAKVKTPKPNKTQLPNESPKKLPGDDKVATNKTPKPTPSPTPTPSAEDANGARDKFNEKFNKKPFQDFADGVVAKLDSNKPEDKIDLKQNFTVVLDGTLTKEGKFDAKKTRFVKGEGNEQMVNLAKSAIEAMGDSNLFSYLQALGVDRVNITLVQDDKQISAVIKSNQQSEERARTISSGFNGIITIANINTKDDADTQTLLKATKFNADGKSFVINFAMPKDQAHQLIDKKLGEARQKKLQPNSNEVTKPDAK